MGCISDIRAIHPTSSKPVAGNRRVTTANGVVEMPYYLIHARLDGATGQPMTAWNTVKYFAAAVSPPLNGPANRLLERDSLGWVYAGFNPRTTGMILANIASPVRAYLEAGHGQV